MIGTLVWKEYREHRLVWVVTAMASCLVLLGVVYLLDFRTIVPGRDTANLILLGAALLAWAYGMVCGALVVGHEIEDGTLSFLDTLPCSRQRLWWTKLGTAALFVGTHTVLLAGVIAFLKVVEATRELLASMALLAAASGIGMAWGTASASPTRTVLHAIGTAVIRQVPAAFAVLVFQVVVLFVRTCTDTLSRPDWVLPLMLMLALSGLALIRGMRGFSEVDRLRPPAPESFGAVRSWFAGWVGLFWLTWRQARAFCWALLACSFAAGWGLLLNHGLLWTVASLVVGVLCGVASFRDEGRDESGSYLGDRRLAADRAWLVKTLVHFAIGLVALVLLLLPCMLRAVDAALQNDHNRVSLMQWLFDNELLTKLATPVPFLMMWALHGFAFGQLSGLFCRRLVFAVPVALLASGVAVSIWVPSLLNVGLYTLQVVVFPLLVIRANWRLFPAWINGEIWSRRILVTVVGTMTVGVVWTAAAIAYRVWEVPRPLREVDVPGFLARLPAPEDNRGGEAVRMALARFDARLRLVSHNVNGLGPEEHVHIAFMKRWPPVRLELLERLMEQLFEDRWITDIREAVRLPLGVVEDPRAQTLRTVLAGSIQAQEANDFLIAHGLWRQAHGDPTAFVDDLETGLGLCRHLASHASGETFDDAAGIELKWARSIQPWLKSLRGHPELLRSVLTKLRQHQHTAAFDLDEVYAADFLLAQRSFDDIDRILVGLQGGQRIPGDLLFAATKLAWQAPWERERNRRLLYCINDRTTEAELLLETIPWRDRIGEGPARPERSWMRQFLPLAQVAVALRCYEAEKSSFPPDLNALVPKYIPELPPSPDESRPMAYHLPAPKRAATDRQPWGEDLAAQVVIWYRRERGGQASGAANRRGLPEQSEHRYIVPPPAPGRRSPKEADLK
jgi:hypothetical protein